MGVKQGLIHIILFDKGSVKEAIADALNSRKNIRVYYPSENGVDKDVLLDQFVNQLLFREGSWRREGFPCARFELNRAFSIITNNKTIEELGGDLDDESDEDIEAKRELFIPLFSLSYDCSIYFQKPPRKNKTIDRPSSCTLKKSIRSFSTLLKDMHAQSLQIHPSSSPLLPRRTNNIHLIRYVYELFLLIDQVHDVLLFFSSRNPLKNVLLLKSHLQSTHLQFSKSRRQNGLFLLFIIVLITFIPVFYYFYLYFCYCNSSPLIIYYSYFFVLIFFF